MLLLGHNWCKVKTAIIHRTAHYREKKSLVIKKILERAGFFCSIDWHWQICLHLPGNTPRVLTEQCIAIFIDLVVPISRGSTKYSVFYQFCLLG
jgi:hypothetical protein